MVEINLFGAPQIINNQQPLTITRRKSRALVYYLAAHPNPLTRDHLLAMFWPDHKRQTGLQNLRSTLYGLRKILGHLLLAEEDTLVLTAEVTVDSRLFETNLTQGTLDLPRLKTTLDLYRAEFLSGFTLPDLPEFDDWALVARERYRRLAISGLARLSELYETERQFREALATLDQALTFDPLQEDVQREALRLHYLAGDRAGAIRRFELFRSLLIDEMGVPPMAETQTLYDAIITDAPHPALHAPAPLEGTARQAIHLRSKPQVQPLPFVGRAIERQRLNTLVTHPQLVLIEGEAGIGKSRLIDQFIETHPHPVVVLYGQARELERSLPYHPLIEALRHIPTHPDWATCQSTLNLAPVWQIEVARLLPELAPADYNPTNVSQAMDEIRLWEGVSQFLLALAAHLPLILAIDDLQWADSATLGLLGYLIRKASQQVAPIIFIAATRPIEPGSSQTTLQTTLLRAGQLAKLHLDRLTLDDITTLTAHLSPTQGDALATWLNRSSEGNPFILTELIRYAQETLRQPDGQFDLDRLPESPLVPPTVYNLIQARLARLSEADWQVLNVAVAIGREFEFEVVAQAVALSDGAVLDSLDTLQNLRLIGPLDGLRYRFDHHLIMEVAYQEISEPRHRLFHRRVAEAMEKLYHHHLDSVAGLLAQHYGEGGVPTQAAKYALRAGELAAGLAAWKEAILFFEQARAATESQGDSAQQQLILAKLGQAYLQTGQAGKGVPVLQMALDLAKAGQQAVSEAVLYMSLSQALMLANRFDELLTLAKTIKRDGHPEQRANAAFIYGLALVHSRSDLTGAIASVQKAEALLRQSESRPEAGSVTLNQIKFELGNISARRGDLTTAITHYQAGLEITRDMESEVALYSHILFHNNLAYHLHRLSDPTAIEYARTGLTLAQEKGILSLLPYLWSTLGEIALAANDLKTAEEHFKEGLSLAQQFSMSERVAGLTANLGLVAKQRGQQPRAIQLLNAALIQTESLQIPFLATQIRLWLIPLLPLAEARTELEIARATAAQDGYQELLANAIRLEKDLVSV